MRIKLYIEGGGDSHLQESQFRAGWTAFFEKAGLQRMPKTIACGGRGQAFDAFRIAVKTRKADELPLLLVDSEDLPAKGHAAWRHLKARVAGGWDKPAGAGEEDAHLMIACMETWFLADRSALREYFGNGWRDNAVPKWPSLEAVEKAIVFRTLERATADCGKKRFNQKYSKGKASFDLLKEIDPAKVEAACPSAKLLLDRLRQI